MRLILIARRTRGILLMSCTAGSLAAAAITMSACTTAAPTVNNDIAAAEVALTAGEQLALVYTSLPRCGSAGASAVCSVQATVDSIKAADNTAYNAVVQARGNSSLINAALSAIASFRALVPASGGQ